MENIDYGRTEEYQHNQDQKSLISTNMSTYTSQAIPDFITGRTELNDETWDAYVAELQSYGCDDVTDWLNEAAGN